MNAWGATDDGDERRVEEDSEEDEDTVVVEELPPLQRPKCGMLGVEPVRVLTGRLPRKPGRRRSPSLQVETVWLND